MSDERMMELLYLLAEQTGEDVSKARVRFYAEKLAPLGSGRVCGVLGTMLEGSRRFPTVNEIKAELGEAPQLAEDRAREAAERIYTALARGWGSQRGPETVKRREDFVGPIGCEVVRLQGGWERLSDTVMAEDATTWKAQWRGLAETVVRKGADAADHGPDWQRLPGADLTKLPGVIDVAKLTK